MNYKQELKRKGIHQLSLAIPIGYLLLPKSFVLHVLIPIALLIVSVDLARLYIPRVQKQFNRFFGPLLRPHENRRILGSSYLITAAVLTIWFFPENHKNYVILSLFFLIICDAAAALIGRKLGKHKIFDKSIEGTAAFFITALLIVFLFRAIPTSHGILGAITATIVELLPLPINDNFSIPIVTCLVIYVVYLL